MPVAAIVAELNRRDHLSIPVSRDLNQMTQESPRTCNFNLPWSGQPEILVKVLPILLLTISFAFAIISANFLLCIFLEWMLLC
jgi:hypothetical protein